MREFYIECNMGASGNRLMSALYELLSQEEQQQFLDTMNQLGSFNTSISAIPSSKCNVQGTKLTISTSNEFSFSQYDLSSIKEFILSLPFSKKVKEDAATIYEMIAEAKMTACNCFSLEETVYPERITSIIGVCILIEKLKPERIIVSPIHVGSGFITRDYGSVPVPTPEVAYLLQGVPSYGGPISDELCTTEGAAILTYFADEFGYLPVMTTEKIGCGIGENDYDMANCVRVFSGTVVENTDPALPDSAQLPASFDDPNDTIVQLSCNLDDMSGEDISFACDQLWHNGAVDVWTTPIQMKKSHPGQMLCCICRPEYANHLAKVLLKHTTAWNVRKTTCDRYCMTASLEDVNTLYGPVTIRKGHGYGVTKQKPDFSSLAQIAVEEDISLQQLRQELFVPAKNPYEK